MLLLSSGAIERRNDRDRVGDKRANQLEERSLRRALIEYVEHFHAERNHQGKGNALLFPRDTHICRERPVQCRERLGGLLRYYHRDGVNRRGASDEFFDHTG
jgi:hypothetical protein